MSEIRVLVVDDSAVVRQVMSEILGHEPGIRVIGTASDPIFALDRMKKEWPDVITLDVEMPRMDGVTFLKKIMAERPTPVVICSSLTQAGAETTMQALAAAAARPVAPDVMHLIRMDLGSECPYVARPRRFSHGTTHLPSLRFGALTVPPLFRTLRMALLPLPLFKVRIGRIPFAQDGPLLLLPFP